MGQNNVSVYNIILVGVAHPEFRGENFHGKLSKRENLCESFLPGNSCASIASAENNEKQTYTLSQMDLECQMMPTLLFCLLQRFPYCYNHSTTDQV